MAHYQNSYNGRAMAPPAVPAAPGPADWSGEIAPLTAESAALPAPGRSVTGAGRPMDRLSTAEERGRSRWAPWICGTACPARSSQTPFPRRRPTGAP